MLRPLRLLLAAALLVGAAASAAPTASAGSYTVWSCRDANWNPAPTDGWTRTSGFTPAAAANAGDSCSAGGSLASFITGGEPSRIYAPMRVGWTYSVPLDLTLVSATLDVAWGVGTSSSDDGATPFVGVSRAGVVVSRDDASLAAGCGVVSCNRAEPAAYTFTPVDRTIGVTVACFSTPGTTVGSPSCGAANGGRAHLYMQRAKFTMAESSPPTADPLEEATLGGQPLSGERTLRFKAYDKGSGLYAAEVRLGGQIVSPKAVLNENGGACTAALKATAFRSAVPCQPSLTVSLPVNTTAVPDGAHKLTVTLWDAADNQAAVIDRTVTVSNGIAVPTPAPTAAPIAPPSGPNGTGGTLSTARFTSKRPETTRTVVFGRKISLADQLVDAAGKPIVGAQVDVLQTRAGGRTEKVATVTSDTRGKVSYRPDTSLPGLVEFAYAVATGSTSYVARRSVQLRVTAEVSLKASSRDVRRGVSVKFTGAVRAGLLPKSGVQVTIETLGPRGWRPAKNVRVDASGRFSWSYAFRIPANWKFRATVQRSSGLRVRPGTSPVLKVRVRR